MYESNSDIRILDENIRLQLFGQGNTAVLYECPDGKVLKLFREDIPFEHIIHEWQNSYAIQQKFDATPKAFELVKYKDRYGMICEKISGTDMMNIAMNQPLIQKDFGEVLADIHLKMHEINVPLSDSLKEKLARDINNGEGLSDDEKQKITAKLDQMPDKYFLCHCDFHPGNVMVTEEGYYVIDWMTACSGDPAADVARFVLLMTLGEPLYADNSKRLLITSGMNKIKKSYLEKYIAESAIEYEEIESWMLFVAAARLSEMINDHERENLIQLIRDNI